MTKWKNEQRQDLKYTDNKNKQRAGVNHEKQPINKGTGQQDTDEATNTNKQRTKS